MSSYPSRIVPQLKDAIPVWLDQWRFTRFVTLATNDPSLGAKLLQGSNLKYGVLRDRLREWDGRMNCQILGKKWAQRELGSDFRFLFP